MELKPIKLVSAHNNLGQVACFLSVEASSHGIVKREAWDTVFDGTEQRFGFCCGLRENLEISVIRHVISVGSTLTMLSIVIRCTA